MSAQAGVNGRTVNCAEFGDETEREGTLQQVARTRWSEDSVVEGEVHAEYVELRRDERSVHLHDESRDTYVQLDLHTRTASDGTSARAVSRPRTRPYPPPAHAAGACWPTRRPGGRRP